MLEHERDIPQDEDELLPRDKRRLDTDDEIDDYDDFEVLEERRSERGSGPRRRKRKKTPEEAKIDQG